MLVTRSALLRISDLGASEVVRSQNVGGEVPWNDSCAVVDAILRLRAEPDLRRQLGANGHRTALREHDWNRLSADFVRVMDAIADRQRDLTLARRASTAITPIATAKASR
jgi:glycosyltransferase involved in cell wall biosynthesis